MKKYSDVKNRLLEDVETKEAYENLAECYDLAGMVLRARISANLTQTELAEKIGTRQSNISRLESGGCNPSFDLLARVAEATGRKLIVDIV